MHASERWTRHGASLVAALVVVLAPRMDLSHADSRLRPRLVYDSATLEATIIHEARHTLGLGEMGSAPGPEACLQVPSRGWRVVRKECRSFRWLIA